MNTVRGIFAPIATAFDASGGAPRRFRGERALFRRDEACGAWVLGSSGLRCSARRKVKLVETARNTSLRQEDHRRNGVRVAETVELTKQCAAAGADVALVVTRTTIKDMNEVALEKFYDARRRLPVPVMIYNMPGNSGVNVPSPLTRLAVIRTSPASRTAAATSCRSRGAGQGSSDFSVRRVGELPLWPPSFSEAAALPWPTSSPTTAPRPGTLREGRPRRRRKMQLALLPLNAAVSAGRHRRHEGRDGHGRLQGGLRLLIPREETKKRSPDTELGVLRVAMLVSGDRFLADLEALGALAVEGEVRRPAYSSYDEAAFCCGEDERGC